MRIADMTMNECLALLSEGHVARLACANAGKPYVVPVHYVLAGRRIYSFSMPGMKISWMRDNPQVCIQHDSIKDACNWRSVVVHGLYRELPDNEHAHAEHMKAWELLQRRPNWWEPGSCTPKDQAGGTKPIFYFIEIVDITGRRALEES
jgi:nitroimidazol reductase NimA-like FMN-containing flavoprotein (pyridoxamine 5'-phosphate oxidase superfamily)